MADADGRHRAPVADRATVGSRRVLAAVVAIAAAGGGGSLLLDPQGRTVAQPDQPTIEPDAGGPAADLTAVARTRIAQLAPLPQTAHPLVAQPDLPIADLPGAALPALAQGPSTAPTPSAGQPSPSSAQNPGRPARTSPATRPVDRAEPDTIDLTGWKVTLPTRGDKGGAALVDPLDKIGPWLNRTASGAFDFWAPSDGATTKNSKHARTELVSQRHFSAGQDLRTLRASVTVTQTPESRNIILGQIHGAGDMKSVPYVMLHYKGGTIEVVVKKGRSGDAATRHTLLTGIPLGARFSFTITDAGNGTMRFSATRGSEVREVTSPVPSAFEGAPVRFQAGAYQLGKSGGGSREGGRVTFHGLTEK